MFPLKDNIPTDRFPVVTVVLIVINTFVYFFLQKHVGTGFARLNSVDDSNVIKWAAIPFEFKHPGDACRPHIDSFTGATGVECGPNIRYGPPAYLNLFAAMFMHGGLLHIGGNMLFLWIFGNNVEDSMGRARFVVFYLLAGLAAFALQILVDPSSTVPTLGASGAIAGVLGGYILLWPRARVLTVIFIIIFFTIVEIPAIFVLGFWFLEQVLFGAYDLSDPTGGGGGVAYFAHIGGFAFGLAAIRAFAKRVKQVPTARFPVY